MKALQRYRKLTCDFWLYSLEEGRVKAAKDHTEKFPSIKDTKFFPLNRLTKDFLWLTGYFLLPSEPCNGEKVSSGWPL